MKRTILFLVLALVVTTVWILIYENKGVVFGLKQEETSASVYDPAEHDKEYLDKVWDPDYQRSQNVLQDQLEDMRERSNEIVQGYQEMYQERTENNQNGIDTIGILDEVGDVQHSINSVRDNLSEVSLITSETDETTK